MRYSTSRCSRRLAIAALGSLGLAVVGGGFSEARAQHWQWRPWVTLASGYENDRIPDPVLDRFIAPGGGFLDLTPGVTLSRRLGRQTRLALTGQGTLERFLNAENRALLGTALEGDLRGVLNGPVQWRVSLGGNYFADSERESVDRLGGGGEAALRFVAARGFFEALGGVEGRRYDNLSAFDDAGTQGTYTEASAVFGAAAGLRVTRDLAVKALATRQATDARDAFYDATALLFRSAVQLRVQRLGWFSMDGLMQQRNFDSRLPAVDSDSYWQVGAGFERVINGGVSVAARYAFARYEQPTSPDEDIHRLTLGVTWRFGSAPLVSGPNESVAGSERSAPREDGLQRFRFHAPNARQVALVGDFNQWDPTAHPLQPVGGGWWEVKLPLTAGAHQYAYLVDGNMVTPPDADVTVDDGFGGKNGLLQVAPKIP